MCTSNSRTPARVTARSFVAWLILLPTAPLLSSCAVNPVTGEREISVMSPEREAALGRDAATQVEAEIGLVRDPKLVGYVQELGARLASRSPRQDVEYQFFVADMPEPNAFALPGGYIYVSRGLLPLINRESELANVLGHEIGHVAARHAAQRETRATGIGVLTVLATVLAGVTGGGDLAQTTAEIGQAAGAGLIAAYGRDQERQADEIGQAIASRAGWAPQGMSTFLASLERDTTLRTGATPRPGYLDSHPALGERVQVTTERAAGLPAGQEQLVETTAGMFARYDGLLLGDDPAGGIFRDQRFLHPELGFAIEFPPGWLTQNQRAAVLAAPRERDALLRLEGQGPSGDPREAAAAFAEANRLRYSTGRVLTIAGYDAYQARAETTLQNTRVVAELTWIAHPGGTFRITGITPTTRFAAHATAFLQTALSFRDLSAQERAGIMERFLAIERAREGESLKELSSRVDNQWSVVQTAVANGLAENVSLRAGQLVKLARQRVYVSTP